MWFLWENMHLTPRMAMVAIAHFSQKVDSCGFASDQLYFQVRAHDATVNPTFYYTFLREIFFGCSKAFIHYIEQLLSN
jgi:hypothetical protein